MILIWEGGRGGMNGQVAACGHDEGRSVWVGRE